MIVLGTGIYGLDLDSPSGSDLSFDLGCQGFDLAAGIRREAIETLENLAALFNEGLTLLGGRFRIHATDLDFMIKIADGLEETLTLTEQSE